MSGHHITSHARVIAICYRVLVSLLVTCIVGCASPPTTVDDQGRSELIAFPTSLEILLSNIKLAVQQGRLIAPEFRSDQNLRAYAGARDVNWFEDGPNRKAAVLRGADYIPIRSSFGPGLGYAWARVTSNETSAVVADANFSLSCSCTLQWAAVEKIFGSQNYVIEDDKRYVGAHTVTRPTSAMGNKVVTYHLATNDKYVGSVAIFFDADGNLQVVEAQQQER